MGRRVLLIVVGCVIAVVLDAFGAPYEIAAIGFAPFALLEAKGLLSPYERSASDMLHGSTDDSSSEDTSTK
jgi:hypothetical protein